MNIIGLVMPIGCLILTGLVIAVAWELKRMGKGDLPGNSMFTTDEIKETFSKYKPYLLSPIGLALLYT